MPFEKWEPPLRPEAGPGSDGGDADAWAASPLAPDVWHADRGCANLAGQAKIVYPVDPAELSSDPRGCRVCTDAEFRDREDCRVCGATLDGNGHCGWCDDFEEVATLD